MGRQGAKPIRKTKKNVLAGALFVVMLSAVCIFLYPFAIPKEVDAAWDRDKKVAEKSGRYVSEKVPEANASVNWNENRLTVTGRGRITQSDAQGKALARRAALTDARRNVLLLREELLGNNASREKLKRISGRVIAPKIHSERTEGSFYLLEIDAPLNGLLQENYVEEWSFIVK